MPNLKLDIKQLADNGGTEPFAPITVPEAVMFSNGDSLSDRIGDTDISSIGNKTSGTTFPFTPPSNGILIVTIRLSAQGRGYITFNGGSPGIVDGYQSSGGYITGALICQKNVQVKITASQNIQSYEWHFINI